MGAIGSSDVFLGPRNLAGKILLVEDQVAVRRMARRILSWAGYEVVEAADGAAALEVIESGYGADLIITDVRMPRMGGAQLAEELLKRDSTIPIIFMTGFAGTDEEDSALYELGRAVLRKPFASEELLSVSAQHIRPNE